MECEAEEPENLTPGLVTDVLLMEISSNAAGVALAMPTFPLARTVKSCCPVEDATANTGSVWLVVVP